MIVQFVKTNILSKKLRNFLTIFSIIISIVLIISVSNITKQLKSNVIANAGTYDILIGANGSSTQLILNSMFFYDKPIANINIEYLEKLQKDNRVNLVVPLAMGDNYKGYKIVGTTKDYFNEKLVLKSGEYFNNVGEVVIGSTVAKVTGLRIGDSFKGMHGLTAEKGEEEGLHDLAHEKFVYKVVGILEPSRTPNDTVVFTLVESVWGVHGIEHEENDEHETEVDVSGGEHEGEEHDHDHHIVTALLLKTKGFAEQTVLTKELSSNSDIQAINPAATLRDLLTTLSVGEIIVTVVAYIAISLSVIVLFITMLSSSIERRKDIAILRSLGANRKTVFLMILVETLVITLIGVIFGFALSHLGIGLLGNYSAGAFGIDISGIYFSISEIYILIGAVILSVFAGIIPAIMVYKTDATKYLK
jgi:putative ABC transport system permease protein